MKCAQGQITMANSEVGISQQQFALSDLKKSIENHLASIVAWTFAVVLLGVVVVLAFPSNSLFGGNLLFVTNKAQRAFDLAYLATSVGFVVIALMDEKVMVKFMRLVGKIYMFAALIGFMKLGSQIYSEWVSVINLGLGMSFVAAGSALQGYRQRSLVAKLIEKQRQSNSYTIMDTIKNSGFNTARIFKSVLPRSY